MTLRLVLIYKSYSTWIGTMEVIRLVAEVWIPGHPAHQKLQTRDELLHCTWMMLPSYGTIMKVYEKLHM